MPKLCICQICVCGRHRCPHKFTRDTIPKDPNAKGKFMSEMKQSYRSGPRLTKVKPVVHTGQMIPATGPMAKTSTTTDDYTPKKAQARKLRQPETYKPPASKMYSQTTYKKDFMTDMNNWPAREPPIKNMTPNIQIPDEKMESRTTQNRDYVSYDKTSANACRGKPVAHRGGTLTVLGQQFKGQSESSKAYKHPGTPQRVSGQAKHDNLYTEGKFEGRPTTAIDYVARKPEPRVKGKPIGSGMKWPNERIKKASTYKTDFGVYREWDKAQPCGPRPAQIQPPHEPFAGLSLYKSDYPAHEANLRSKLPWEPNRQYVKPIEQFAGDTTYKKDFIPPPEDILPEKGKRLSENLTVGGDAMTTVTTHRLDYIPHSGVQPVLSMKTETPFVPPTTKFAGESTTRHDYLGQMGEKAYPIKTTGNLTAEEGPMDLVTTTGKDYLSLKLDCPAARLKMGDKDMLEQYKFVDASREHEYYEKLRQKRRSSN